MPPPVKGTPRHRAAAALSLAFSLAAAHAVAELPAAEPIHFELRSPGGCSSVDDFAARVRKRSARLRLVSGPAPRSLLVVIREAPPGTFQGSVRVSERGGGGRARQLKASSCAELVEGLSLIATVTLDPDSLLAEPEPEPAPAPAPEPEEPPPAPPKPMKPPARPPEPRRPEPPSEGPSYRLSLGAGAALILNQAPAFAPGASAAVALELRPGRVLAPFMRLSVVHAQRRNVEEAGGAASFAFTLPTLDFCPVRFGPPTLGVRPCLYGSLGVLEAWGSAAAGGETHRRLSGSAGGALWLGFRVSEVFEIVLDGRVGGVAPRDRFGFDGRGFFTTPALGFSAGLGVAGGFP
jgi:hypothetical protein